MPRGTRPVKPEQQEPDTMTYVVTEACIRCKYMDCVEVCPVDCFYEGENMLVIHPDECIDCGVCEPECPVEAIIPDSEAAAERWLELNRDYAATGRTSPARSRRRRMPTSGKTSTGKYEKFFSPNPGGLISATGMPRASPAPVRPRRPSMADVLARRAGCDITSSRRYSASSPRFRARARGVDAVARRVGGCWKAFLTALVGIGWCERRT